MQILVTVTDFLLSRLRYVSSNSFMLVKGYDKTFTLDMSSASNAKLPDKTFPLKFQIYPRIGPHSLRNNLADIP